MGNTAAEIADVRAGIAAMDEGEMQVAAEAAGAIAAAAAGESAAASLAFPPRPCHAASELQAVQLLEAVSRHDLVSVICIMGVRSKRQVDRTMTHVSAASVAMGPARNF